MSRETKDSGIEWIGEIPEDWEVVKLGIVADISTGNTLKDPDNIKYSKSEGIDWLKTNNLLGVDGVSNSSLKIKEQYISEARLTNPRSVLVTCIGDIGKLGYTSKPVAFNQQINSITFTKDIIYWKYGMYALYSQREQQESFANGNVLKILNRENQKKVVITVPKDINKQIKISNTLDKICLYIRKLVDKTQLSIKELKKYKQSLITESVTKGLDPNVEMKDSGIKWIDNIPKHWDIRSIGNYYLQVKDKNLLSQEENLLSLSYGKIVKRNYHSADGLLPANFNNYIIVEPNDIVLRMTDLQNDHKSLRTGFVNESGIITSAYITLRPRKNQEFISKFIQLFLHSFDIYKGFYGMGSGVRQNVTFNDIKKIKIILPPIIEQKQIIRYLENKVSTIDNLIENKIKVIEELENYKKSLIYEYVTGKKEV
ncbi:restriction endonuclease subunit S [Staphylococcus epidermidis]|uniref:restriction endonuclease subunit S n=1 Tax=Staphylococcus epidermidis TaxID=1282 RepID=UPI00138AF923|nr:restriction endonuclease subunit S [Staphylococcus epidermidis]MBF2283650.1 restriction endonuclease subunit S [Staphylococcus epidermidis]MBF2289689.1 restriction endonuclease subunit S [Staphylococcus epidermidis]MBF2290763.1 restriction endonuclease subunit S [Staphylococcus epidermidis]MBF2293515.1 restriction endonuclease subunit S [Staphylococcus epidermidis]MBF2298955.1 restriction endonuclease subunit S [Staphylococcus epidermidis]